MRGVKRKSGVSATVRVKFTRRLLAWWARAARDLPWRRTRDPYRLLQHELGDEHTIRIAGTAPWQISGGAGPPGQQASGKLDPHGRAHSRFPFHSPHWSSPLGSPLPSGEGKLCA